MITKTTTQNEQSFFNLEKDGKLSKSKSQEQSDGALFKSQCNMLNGFLNNARKQA
jgi:hypothetical protein